MNSNAQTALQTPCVINRPLLFWLGACIALVFLMVVIGGLTRLTESGLSIVEWKPVTGTLPPLSVDAWAEEFAKYKGSPQYRQVNHGIGLAEFKNIFWLEYVHRLFGRVTGVVFFLPLIYFWVRKQLPASLKPRLAIIFLLGAAQGALGWYMVKSGLIDVPAVSPYRLSAHLLMAFALLGLLLWSYLDIAGHRWHRITKKGAVPVSRIHTAVLALLGVQIGIGGLVAGLDAGLIYNSFPDMNGRFLPSEMFFLHPVWRNFFENPATVQFCHRIMAFIVAATLMAVALHTHAKTGDPALKRACCWLIAMVMMQFGLGVATLLSQVAVPLASLHQAFALILFGQCVMIRHGFTGSKTAD